MGSLADLNRGWVLRRRVWEAGLLSHWESNQMEQMLICQGQGKVSLRPVGKIRGKKSTGKG